MQNLSRAARMEILENVEKTVTKHFYDAKFCGVDWPACVNEHRDAVSEAETPEAFERSITELLSELKSSHMGFFHHSLKRVSSKMAISATYASFHLDGEDRWVFQDVHEGGAAELAGLRSGDIILSVDGRPFSPPEHPIFPVGQSVKLKIITRGEREEERIVDIPSPKR